MLITNVMGLLVVLNGIVLDNLPVGKLKIPTKR